MSEIYAPMMRALVVAALTLATATLMFVAVNTAKAAGQPALGPVAESSAAYDSRGVEISAWMFWRNAAAPTTGT